MPVGKTVGAEVADFQARVNLTCRRFVRLTFMGRSLPGCQIICSKVSNIDHAARGLAGIVVRDRAERGDLFLVAPVSTLVGQFIQIVRDIEIGGLRHDEV